ncbi:Cytospin-A [Frankliniella fusca]|uniref:Cytospin-A n=1 Tax=Frankliniella fusca TaxID=407009 RepID=A0AAE1LSH8_9NEOP|nr:Cytospin-A [Frankliniella fusca]
MKLLVAVAALCVAAASAASTYQQSAKATLDFINHEQAHGAAEANAPPATAAPRPGIGPATTPRPPAAAGGQQQQHLAPGRHGSTPAPATTVPKKDWELLPPRQAVQTTPRTAPTYRPNTPTYAGVVRDHGHGQDHQVRLPSLPPTTTRPRVYNIPIVVEDRANYTTTTEQSRWYDKLFGKGTDVDDGPWDRRRRQAAEAEQHVGAPRSEVVVGTSAIRVVGARPRQGAAQTHPRPDRS